MLFTSLAAIALGQSLGEEVRLMRYPDISGNQVVFTYASDLWLADLNGGAARRLTSHPGMEQHAKFSPDGKWIAFSGQYDGGMDVYKIPVTGGTPTRLTYENGTEFVREWTNDGKKIAFASNYGNHTTRMPRLWFVDADGGMPERTAVQESFDVSFSPDGSQMAFTRANSHVFNWRRYRGGTQGRIAFWDFAKQTYTEIPTGREQSYFPMWVGDRVFFISDKNQLTQNLYSYDTKSKKVTQLTKFDDGDIRWPSTDGKTIVFERNLRLFSMDIASGAIKQLDPRVSGDDVAMRPRFIPGSNSIGGMALSPSGKRLVVEARGEVFSVPARSGETRNMSRTSGARENQLSWSNDGQFVYYMTDKSGEWQLVRQPQMGGAEEVIKLPTTTPVSTYSLAPNGDLVAYRTIDFAWHIFDIKTGKSTKVFQDMGSPRGIDWSADSKWLTYAKTLPNLMQGIMLYDVTAGKEHQVTSGVFMDSAPSFDLTGKYLYFISGRDYGPGFGLQGAHLEQGDIDRVYMATLSADTPNPLAPEEDEEPVKASGEAPAAAPATPAADGMKVDVEGLESRVIALPYPVSSYGGVIGVRDGVIVSTGTGELSLFNLRARVPQTIMPTPQVGVFNADRTKIAYLLGGQIAITDVRPGVQVGAGRVDTSAVGHTVDPREEFKQIFWDAWRYNRDQFYDKDMLGLDWKAIGKKYEAMLPYAGDRSDLDYILGQLIGELGTGHAYNTPAPAGSDPMSQPAGFLGADLVNEGGKVKMSKIYRGPSYLPSARGPLGALGVNVKDGEFILAINGEPVTAQTGVTPHLVGKINKRVTLTVNDKPTMEGARTVNVVPTASESQLRYQTWVDERRELVHKLSDGKIGYMHVPDTSVMGIIMFVRGFYSEQDKQAWVIDERYNGGGFIPTFFIEYLQREANNTFGPRHGANVNLPSALNGPKAMLINEHAGSGGDLLPYLFKKSGLGPLIGTRTWGGLVGIQGTYGLLGGSGVTAPGFGIYDPQTGKWIAENTGVDPDIFVDDTPEVAAKGRDVQLERAVEYLKGELKKVKPLQPRPAAPKVGGN